MSKTKQKINTFEVEMDILNQQYQGNLTKCLCGEPSMYWWKHGKRQEPLGVCEDCSERGAEMANMKGK